MTQENEKQFIELDPKDFKLSDYDNVHISMPRKPELSEDDVDAQLFEYVASGGKKINSIADLDDDWVQNNFDGMSTIDDVRQAIKDEYDRELEYQYADIKLKECGDVFISRLEGDIDEDVLQNNIEVMKRGNLARLEEMHIPFQQYLREEHLTQEQYDEKVRKETLRQMQLNVALDIMADVLNMQVGNHEICDYLSTPNPEKFLEEIREKDQVENARRAAVRIKVMRRAMDTAVIEEEGEMAVPIEPEDDIEIPDFENMPEPQIRED